MPGKTPRKVKSHDCLDEMNLCCDLPPVPERKLDSNIDLNRESLIRYIEKKWVNHTVLHYYFMTSPTAWRGNEAQKKAVRDAFNKWKALGIGLEFVEVSEAVEAEIRIGFQRGGSWSYVGRDAIDLVPNASERTMNFGWDLTTAYGRDTALHEIGHALGFPHEHQNPNAGIVWDKNAVYSYFGGPPNNWSRQKTHHNIIRKISQAEVQGSQWDKNSIMHYQFQAGLIIEPPHYRDNPLIPASGLSKVDIAEAKKFYPAKTTKKLTELKPFRSQLLSFKPGEQLDLLIKPEISRRYQMQTFGQMDTVMVLFEDVDGEPVLLDGDDDSGSHFNALIETRLLRGRSYYLRIRLYYASSNGLGAVMMW